MAPIETKFGAVTGNVTCVVLDPNGVAPNTNIIRLADTWQVKIGWNLTGSIVNMLNGDWHVRVYMESIGPQPDPILLDKKVPFSAGIVAGNTLLLDYSLTENFGPNYVAPNVVQEGVYKLVAVVTCTTPNNTPGPFAGFAEVDLLQFYNAAP